MQLFSLLFFFFNDTATTEIYTLSLHDALPISARVGFRSAVVLREHFRRAIGLAPVDYRRRFVAPRTLSAQPEELRSEEHTSELQSRQYLVCRLLLEKKKKTTITRSIYTYC